MRLLAAPPAVLSFVALLLTHAQPSIAGPFSRSIEIDQPEAERLSQEESFLSLQNSTLELKKRQQAAICSSSQFNCGYYAQLCCESGSQTCGINAAGEAICVAAAGGGSSGATAVAGSGGSWQLYTSIWTTTGAITMTSIYSSYIGAATAASAGTCTPNYANNESQCGATCCSSGQYCVDPNQGICKPAGNGGYTTTGVANSPPTRPTTSNGVIITLTMTPTTTVPYRTPVPTGQSGTAVPVTGGGGGGLSGGAIAGIVIGVLAGIVLLVLICLCCCLKAGFDGILALLGIGKKKDRRRRVVEEEYVDVHRRYGSQAGSGRRWYGSAAGGRPGRPPPPPPPKKSRIGNLGAIGLGLGGLAVALGLKRRHDRKHDEKSDVSSSYYDSYYYSSSSGSGSRRGGSRREHN